jgi:hypothetical protein
MANADSAFGKSRLLWLTCSTLVTGFVARRYFYKLWNWAGNIYKSERNNKNLFALGWHRSEYFYFSVV